MRKTSRAREAAISIGICLAYVAAILIAGKAALILGAFLRSTT